MFFFAFKWFRFSRQFTHTKFTKNAYISRPRYKLGDRFNEKVFDFKISETCSTKIFVRCNNVHSVERCKIYNFEDKTQTIKHLLKA